MQFSAALHRRLHWLNLPGTLLIALLQRTPAVRVAASAADIALVSPVGAVLKAAAATLGALGAVHSLAGATTLSASTPSPASATVGKAITTVVFDVRGAQSSASSWTITSGVPPGLVFAAFGASGGGITSGTINASLLQLTGTPTAAGQFVISLRAWENNNGNGTSTAFSYVINVAAAANSAPTITTQPASATVLAGGSVVFNAAAAGSPAPTFQWFKNGTAIPNATSSSLVVSGAAAADAGSYVVVASNSVGSATSNAAVLTVNGPTVTAPAISLPPASINASVGGTATLAVVATGSPSYQWRKNGVPVPGATAASLTLTPLTTADTAGYDVVLTNSAGTVTSAAAAVIVAGPLTARLSNLSVRTTLTANQLLTVGLTVSGGSKQVLLRAAGPALAALGVTGTMADPKLALFNNQTQITANDNWANASAIIAANAAVGAFAFPANSLDAALIAGIDGGRTAQVSGPTAGNVIVEAYDTVATNTPRLVNLSALNFVGTGGDVLIAGFTVAGTGTKNLLIRAAGPSLGALGVPGTLVDPKLVLRDSNQTVVAENDTYAAALAPVFAATGAFAFVPGAKDAALIVSLPAGGYTVTVSGADGGTGAAIVEVYELN